MDSQTDNDQGEDVVRTLTRKQRRVLGVLLEKAFTTPDQYPLTPKAATSGSNQKSNRDPVTSYEEDDVLDTLDELRRLGLVLEVHTESGRTSRFRHQMRHHYTFTEPQLAILTELMLRGRQSLGDLRSRASRMVPIDGLDTLRSELAPLVEQGFVRAGGPLERRGVEVDHGFYPPNERVEEFPSTPAEPERTSAPASSPATSSPNTAVFGVLEKSVAELQAENREFREELAHFQQRLQNLESQLDDLRRDLGV